MYQDITELADTLSKMGDWPGAERACRRSLVEIHDRFQRPARRENLEFAAQKLGYSIPAVIDQIEMHVLNRQSLVREYAASVAAAHQLLREKLNAGS